MKSRIRYVVFGILGIMLTLVLVIPALIIVGLIFLTSLIVKLNYKNKGVKNNERSFEVR